MKFIIPQKEDLTRETIKEEFLKKYYPELKVSEGWWNILGRYVMLQKSPLVCAKFFVKQKNKEGKTQILIGKDMNMWAYIIGAPIFSFFFRGDFYEDLNRNFKSFLKKKYGLGDADIEVGNSKHTWLFLGVNLLIIFVALCATYGLYMYTPNRSYYSYDRDSTNYYGESGPYYKIYHTSNDKGDLVDRLYYMPEKKLLAEDEYISISDIVYDDSDNKCVVIDRDNKSYNVYKDGVPLFEDGSYFILISVYSDVLAYTKRDGSTGYCDLQGNEVHSLKTFLHFISADLVVLLSIVFWLIVLIIVNIWLRKMLRKKSDRQIDLTPSDDSDVTII